MALHELLPRLSFARCDIKLLSRALVLDKLSIVCLSARYSSAIGHLITTQEPQHCQLPPQAQHTERAAKMISDDQLYTLAIFLGSAAMLLIILYHFLEVNSEDHVVAEKPKAAAGKVKS